MRLSWVQQAHLIASLLEFVVQIFMIAGGRLHANHDLVGSGIQPAQFLFPDAPALSRMSKGGRLDHDAFVGSSDAPRTKLASDVNPTDVFDLSPLDEGGRWGP
jgi:hypothetical protein